MTDELRIHVSHGRELGICVSGQRRFCKAHGLDFKKLLREGIPVSEVEKIDDSFCARVIAHARSK